jgi:ribosomal-protein-alanine N-acetyltransferase
MSLQFDLRKTTQSDLPHLFELQTNDHAIHLAAFTPENPKDREPYLEKWTQIIVRLDVHMYTVFIDDEVRGSVAAFVMFGERTVSYWHHHAIWGKGYGTAILNQFLTLELTRPLHARVAFDNYGSQRVLEKCGFVKTGVDRGFANARQAEIEEFLYELPVSFRLRSK